ncbi:MAG: hypothetical protein RLO81_01830 [Fulvivirga sp.]|uniref:hypothetical protein n=1 Tax=Fulvivirga sp. TaxID=1931237 RepID=UPI0032F02D50
MKKIIITLLLTTSIIAYSQDDLPEGHEQFMMTHFNNIELASKMLAYDHVAWVSSDSILTLSKKELNTYGGQWFCYLDSVGIYHALYGAFDSTYTLTAHYLVDSTTFEVYRTFEPFDTVLAVQYSKAYNIALSRKKEFLGPEDKLRYNHFIFRTDTTVNVHFLPAFQPNGYMIYGAEQHYTLDANATTIIDTVEYFNEYRGYQATPNKEITIAYEDLDYNPLGAVFFLMYYEQYFKSILILTKNYVSTFINEKKNEGSWIHVVRTTPKEKKKRNKKDNP